MATISGQRRISVSSLVVALVIQLSALVVFPAPGWAEPNPGFGFCRDVRIIGVRGSGQTNDYGSTIQQTVNGTLVRLAGTSLEIYDEPLEYTAHGAGVDDIIADLEGLAVSVAQGTDRMLTRLRDEAARCPDQMILLAGYSQGAWVIHNALDVIADEEEVAGRIGGVALVADPRRSNPDAVNRGGAGQSTGIASWTWPSLNTPVPDRFAAATTSLCVDNDPICDFTVANLRFKSRHSNYASNGMASDVASSWLVRRAKTIPASMSRDLGDLPWGESIRVRIDRLGASGAQTFAVDPFAPIPPGLSLSSSGVLSGRARAEGDYHFQVIATGPYGDQRHIAVRLGITSPTFMLSSAEDGTPADATAFGGAFLPGGRVFMNSAATNLASGDEPGTLDMFVKDLDSGVFTRYPTPAGLVLDFGLPAPDGATLMGNFHTDDDAMTADVSFVDTSTGAVTEGYRGDGALSPIWLGDSSGVLTATPDDLTGDGQLISQPDSIPVPQMYLLRRDGIRLRLRPMVGNRPLTVGIIFDSVGTRVLFGGARVLANGTFDEPSDGIYDYDTATGQVRRFDLDADGNSLMFRTGSPVYALSGNRLLISDGSCPGSTLFKSPGRTDPVPITSCDGEALDIVEQLSSTLYAVHDPDGSAVYDARTGTLRQLATDIYGAEPRCAGCRYFTSGSYGPMTYDGFMLFTEYIGTNDSRILMRRYQPAT
jgi:hypothetical protein